MNSITWHWPGSWGHKILEQFCCRTMLWQLKQPDLQKFKTKTINHYETISIDIQPIKFISILQEWNLINSADIFNSVRFNLDNFNLGKLKIQTWFIPNILLRQAKILGWSWAWFIVFMSPYSLKQSKVTGTHNAFFWNNSTGCCQLRTPSKILLHISVLHYFW